MPAVRLGDIANEGAQEHGKPLDGVRVLAAEQMQALPYATQMLARLGAEVVKVEHPVHGESGRGSTPAMTDPQGRQVGATYLRNNLGKRSLGLDLKSPAGRELFLDLVANFDVVAENFKAGTMDRMGLGYDVIADRYPRAIYVSISGFGNSVETPYRDWPAYASIVEAMSGIYDYKNPDSPPVTIPVGALGDISSALYAVIGMLAALRHRDHTGRRAVRRHRDAGRDGCDDRRGHELLVDGGAAGAGQRARGDLRGLPRPRTGTSSCRSCASTSSRSSRSSSGRPEWQSDPRFATRAGWMPEPRVGDPARRRGVDAPLARSSTPRARSPRRASWRDRATTLPT